MRTKLIAGILVLALVATSFGVITAKNPFSMQASAFNKSGGSGWMDQLTEEEKAEVRQKMGEFKQKQYNETLEFKQKQKDDAEAFRQQICDQYNITLPSIPQFRDKGDNATRDGKRSQKHGFWRGSGWFLSGSSPSKSG